VEDKLEKEETGFERPTEEELKRWASMTPEERLAEAYRLTLLKYNLTGLEPSSLKGARLIIDKPYPSKD
jgi:hypothetical protein